MTTQALTQQTATAGGTRTSYAVQRIRTQAPIVLADGFFALASFSVATIFLPAGNAAWEFFPAFLLSVGVSGFSTGMFRIIGVHAIVELRQIVSAVLMSMVLLIAVTLTVTASLPLSVLILAHLVLAVSLPVLRAMVRSELARTSWWGVRCFVFDCGRRVNTLMSQHFGNRTSGFIPVGFVEPSLPTQTSKELRSLHIGNHSAASATRDALSVHTAIVHRYGRPEHEMRGRVEQMFQDYSRVCIAADDMSLPTLWHDGYENRTQHSTAQLFKRAVDLVAVITVLIVGFPILVLLAAWTYVTDPGPIFFGHERIGKDGRRFKVWKFRTMVVNAQEVLDEYLASNPEAQAEWDATYKLQNDPRITTVGHLLRKTSLDELPQLWNVIKGEMSLVGPRPIVTGEVERYADTYAIYLSVRPGITGFWQISGRNLTTYDRRVELDRFYVRNWSIWFDLYVLGRTVKTVICREGAF